MSDEHARRTNNWMVRLAKSADGTVIQTKNHGDGAGNTVFVHGEKQDESEIISACSGAEVTYVSSLWWPEHEATQVTVLPEQPDGLHPGPKKKLNLDERKHVCKWNQDGLSYDQIVRKVANKFGKSVSHGAVYRYCTEFCHAE